MHQRKSDEALGEEIVREAQVPGIAVPHSVIEDLDFEDGIARAREFQIELDRGLESYEIVGALAGGPGRVWSWLKGQTVAKRPGKYRLVCVMSKINPKSESWQRPYKVTTQRVFTDFPTDGQLAARAEEVDRIYGPRGLGRVVSVEVYDRTYGPPLRTYRTGAEYVNG